MWYQNVNNYIKNNLNKSKKLIAWPLFLVLLWSYIVGVQMVAYAIGVLYYFMAFYGSCNTVCTSMVLQIKLVIDVVGFS